MVILVLGRVLVSGSYALLLLQTFIGAHCISSLLLFLDRNVGSLQVLNIDDVINSLASISSDILRL